MFILSILIIGGLTITALHWQTKFSETGQKLKSFSLATVYTIFSFQFYENHKVVFIITFFYVSIALWCLAVVSTAFKKHWTIEPKEEPYHN